MADRPFHIFGPSHLAAMLATALFAIGVALFVRRNASAGRTAERTLAVVLLAATALYVAIEVATGSASPWDFLPLHLCDMAIFVAAYGLVTHRALACEVLYFWAFAGTLLAIVTPDVAVDFPSRAYFFYFGLHAGVVAAATTLTFGSGLRPRTWAPMRIWLVTNAYAGMVAIVNVAFDTNYMYLTAKPEQPSLLDWFGPWPIYILACDVVALALFYLLYLPVRRPRSGSRA